jgi:hypothetical protein
MTKLRRCPVAAAVLLLTATASHAAPNSDQIAFTRVPDHTLYCNMNNTGGATILEVRPSRWEVVKIDASNKAETLVIKSGGFVPGTAELSGIRFGNNETLTYNDHGRLVFYSGVGMACSLNPERYPNGSWEHTPNGQQYFRERLPAAMLDIWCPDDASSSSDQSRVYNRADGKVYRGTACPGPGGIAIAQDKLMEAGTCAVEAIAVSANAVAMAAVFKIIGAVSPSGLGCCFLCSLVT